MTTVTQANGSLDALTMVATKRDQIDWQAMRDAIVGQLDIGKEFEALGIQFSAASANEKGWRPCHAIDRPDENPSAAVNIESGVYHDLGGDGTTLNLFDFAWKHGSPARCWHGSPRILHGFPSNCAGNSPETGPVGRERLAGGA